MRERVTVKRDRWIEESKRETRRETERNGGNEKPEKMSVGEEKRRKKRRERVRVWEGGRVVYCT